MCVPTFNVEKIAAWLKGLQESQKNAGFSSVHFTIHSGEQPAYVMLWTGAEHVDGQAATFEEALAIARKKMDPVNVATRKREEAAKLIAEAAQLEAEARGLERAEVS